ncbi:aminopeptidase N [Amycolatopsis sp. MtRt-6]|uniref:aminopeptidase N n=1 Tax=Amycolatopsis sp. MtRt-6 TaxID=2792782 RepID=UPI001A8E03B2|nr:aminopeptidase N [Amycolatopsis sp. MtRt-6]
MSGSGSPLAGGGGPGTVRSHHRAPALTRAEAAARSAIVHDPVYEVELDLRAPTEFATRTTVRFGAVAGTATFIDFAADEVEHASFNGRPIAASEHRIRLPDLQPGNELVVHARSGYSRTGLGLHRFQDPADGETCVYTQCQPFEAHRIYPCFDQPDLKARIGFRVLAPEDWLVVSNGSAESTGPSWRFTSVPRIPTYVGAVAAGPFHHVRDTHHGLPLNLYCRRSLAPHLDAAEIFRLTKEGLDFCTGFFGHPYPFASYDQVFVPEFPMGGMENAACVLLDERFVFPSPPGEARHLTRATVVFHEMVHMWFGNLVTMRWWDDLWLNESFATYLASRGVAEATRFGERAWVEFSLRRKARAYEDDQGQAARPVLAEVATTDGLLSRFDSVVYGKGAALLRQLEHWVGQAGFQAAVREFIRVNAFGVADRTDFFAALDHASGRVVDDWVRHWLRTTGVPTLRAETVVGDDGRYRFFGIRQLPAEPGSAPRGHRVAIGLYRDEAGALTRTELSEVDVDDECTAVPALVGAPAADLVLLNDDDLAYARTSFDAISLETLIGRLSDIPDTLPRVLCWNALWDMTRSASLPTRDWVEVVIRHAVAEREPAVLRGILRQTTYAVHHFCAAGRVPGVHRSLAEAARAALAGAGPGSTHQKIWCRYVITHDPDPAFARGLLSGEVTVDGLTVDRGLRWHVVIRLAASGVIGEDVIAAERDGDPADRRAWLAWAGRPEPAAKAEAFAAALDGVRDGRSLSLATRDAILTGFWRPGQEEVLAAYAEGAWVDAIRRLWAEPRTEEERLTLTEALYPACRASPEVLASADRALRGTLPAAARGIVKAGREETLVALRAQDADGDARMGER